MVMEAPSDFIQSNGKSNLKAAGMTINYTLQDSIKNVARGVSPLREEDVPVLPSA